MSEVLNFEFTFVDRSKKLLLNNWSALVEQDLEVTTLLNCTISLICLIEASIEKGSYQMQQLDRFIQERDFYFKASPFDISENQILSSEQKLLTELTNLQSIPKYTSLIFLKKLRNSLAHGNIKPINEPGVWKTIRIWNRKLNGAKNINFMCEIETLDLLNFYNSLADVHISSLSN